MKQMWEIGFVSTHAGFTFLFHQSMESSHFHFLKHSYSAACALSLRVSLVSARTPTFRARPELFVQTALFVQSQFNALTGQILSTIESTPGLRAPRTIFSTFDLHQALAAIDLYQAPARLPAVCQFVR